MNLLQRGTVLTVITYGLMEDFNNTEKANLLLVPSSSPGYTCMYCVLFLPINHSRDAVVTFTERSFRNALAFGFHFRLCIIVHYHLLMFYPPFLNHLVYSNVNNINKRIFMLLYIFNRTFKFSLSSSTSVLAFKFAIMLSSVLH